MDVAFAVLGGLRVVIGGIDVTPRASKEKQLLALLVMHRGSVVGRDRLVEELWPELPSARGRRVLQVRVAALRKELGRAGAASLLQSVPPGYRFQLDGDSLDVDRFEALVAVARGRADAGDLEDAATAFRSGLALWHGDAYADAQGCASVEVEAARLDSCRLAALEERIAAELAVGCHQQLAPELDALVARHPLRERLWEHRVLALYRCGRQAEALRACTAIRERLRDELGVEPGPGLRELEAAVLAQQPALSWAPAPPPADPVPAVDGHQEGVAGRGGAATTNLPTVEPLVGREHDVARVAALVRSRRLATVTGPGGVGKSVLALAVAHDLAPDWPDGTWLVELAPLGDPAGLLGAVAGALPLPGMAATAAELADRIGLRRMLVVLDNCEHLVDDVALLVAQLLSSCPQVHVLCTSQEALAVDREHVWPLQPLSAAAAMALFVERAEAVRPDAAHDPAAVAGVVERLDGLPLAIELAAARVSTFTAEEIAAHLDHRFALLSGGVRRADPRHRALQSMVDWSHELLRPGERTLFRRLAVFSGGFSREAATEVAGVESDPASLVGVLDQLVRRSLVVAEVEGPSTRYRLLETMRQYARDRLAEAGETQVIAGRHAAWYADHARRLHTVLAADEHRGLAIGVAELDNIRDAVGFALEARDTDLAVGLVGALWPLTNLWRAEMLDWAQQVLLLPGAEVHPDVGYVHVTVMSLTQLKGDRDRCEQACDEALRRPLDEGAWTLARMTKASMLGTDHVDECRALLADTLGRVTTPHNRVLLRSHIVAIEAYSGVPSGIDTTQLIADADALGGPSLRAFARTMVAIMLVSRGRSAEAPGLLHEALAIAGPGLNRASVNRAHEVLALATGVGPDPDASGDLADRAAGALALSREYPDGMGYAIIGLVVHAWRAGQEAEAALLAGYLSAHLDELSLSPRSAALLAGAPPERFVTPTTEAGFLRGTAMTAAELHAELERLAGAAAPANVTP